MRYLAVSLPTFAVDRVRKGLEQRQQSVPAHVVLVDEDRGSQRVVQCSQDATRLGVRRGMSLAHALALVSERDSLVERHDPVGERAELEELCHFARRFSPHVAPDPPDGILLEVTGSERLFRGEGRLLERVLGAFEALTYACQGAVASTIGCAVGLARSGRERAVIVPAGGEADVLAPLSTAALRLDAAVVDALAEVGVERIGELYELPRETLPARFGADLLLRLDQALGEAFEPFEPLPPKAVPEVARSFEAPVGHEVMTATVRASLEELAGGLRERGEALLVLRIEIECAEARPIREDVVLSRAHASFEHLWSLVAPSLERFHLGFGAERIALSAPRTVPAVEKQASAWDRRAGGPGPDRRLAELVDTLVGRLGREGVLGLQTVETHLPEAAFRALPCTEAWEEGQQGLSGGARITTLPRPSRLFSPPEKVEVEQGSAGEPLRFVRAGEAHGIVRRFGPERIAVPWWRGSGSPGDRDYYCVQDHHGRWLWLVLDVNGRWFLHGEWF